MADNVPVTAGVGTNIASDDVSGVQYQRVKRSVGADGSATDFLDVASRSDTFTGTGNGTSFGVSTQGVDKFSIQVKGTGAAPTSWTVNLQISLNGSQWTTVLIHTNTDTPDGEMVVSGANRYPALFFRSNVSALSLGGASNIVVTICGK